MIITAPVTVHLTALLVMNFALLLSLSFLYMPFSIYIHILRSSLSGHDVCDTPGEHVFMTDMYSKYAQFRELAVKGLPRLSPCPP